MNPAAAAPRRFPPLAAAALIAAATFAAYAPALRGGYIWDDDAHVTRPELRSARGLLRIWFDLGATQQYYPLLHSAFWIEHRLWGDSPLGYHLLNVCLHAAAAVLVLLVLRRLLDDRPAGGATALLTALVFALHPVHVESVAWISEQKNTLSAVLYLSAMLAYLRFDRTRGRGAYGAAIVLFTLALLTKSVTATLPAALLVIFWWQRGRLAPRRDVLPLLPWFPIAAVAGSLTAWVEYELIGAQGQAFELDALQRLLLAGRVVWFYAGKLVWPAELLFIYPRWTIDAGDWTLWLSLLALAALVAGLAFAARRHRAPLAGALFFVGSLFPVLGFFNVYPFLFSYVANHFQYLASLGLLSLLCAAAAGLSRRIPSPVVRAGVLMVVPAVLGVMTFNLCRTFRDDQTLYEATIRRNPSCWMAFNNLGIVLKKQGRFDAAIEHYREALRLRPDYPEAYNNLAVIFNATGRFDDAIAAGREALRLRPANREALGNLAVALAQTGRYDEALEKLSAALKLDPRNAGLHRAAGIAWRAAGRIERAMESLRQAVELEPTAADARFELAATLAQAGRGGEAIEQYEAALRIRPDHLESRTNLAALLARAGRAAEALPHFAAATRLAPGRFELQMNLAVACSSIGRFDDALAAAQRALDLARAAGRPEAVSSIEQWIEGCRSRQGANRHP